MDPRRSLLLVVSMAVAFALAIWSQRSRGVLAATASSMRTSSAPSARMYARLGRLIGPLYERFAGEAAIVLGGVPSPRVLEIGPGPGDVAVRLARVRPDLTLFGLDIDEAMVDLASARARRTGLADRVRFIVGDVAAIPFATGSFDLVLSSFSAHHWPDGPAAFAEIRRVLGPGGRLLVYDLPDRWGRFETGAAGLEESAMAGGFRRTAVSELRWPFGLPLVRRLEAVVPGTRADRAPDHPTVDGRPDLA